MVNVSLWCLPTTVHNEWCARYYYIGIVKKVIHLDGKTALFYNMMYTQIIHKHIYHIFQYINEHFRCMN